MEHEYDQDRKHARAAHTSHQEAVEPGQSSRSHLLRKPDQPIASGLVQRDAGAAGAMEPSAIQAAAARGVATASSQLPYLDAIQRAFGRHDISSVQAHTGPEAAASAREMGAAAYATGNHVVLGGGTDLHTVAHEAAHVVQQRGGVQLKGGVGAEDDEHERHADAVADLVVQGKSAERVLDQHASAASGQAVQRMADPNCQVNVAALAQINNRVTPNRAQIQEATDVIARLSFADLYRTPPFRIDGTLVRLDVQGVIAPNGRNWQVQLNGVNGHSTISAMIIAGTLAAASTPERQAFVQRSARNALVESLNAGFIFQVTGNAT